MKVAIVDLGINNALSLENMLWYVGVDTKVIRRPSEVTNEELVFFPGVGSFDSGMERLRSENWDQALKGHLANRKIVGLCLGMQLLGESSEEGKLPGLGLLPISFKAIKKASDHIKSPHMGWNSVEFHGNATLSLGQMESTRFYFVHSFASYDVASPAVEGITNYGLPFVSMARNANVLGVQFHPEKSHSAGKLLLAQICGEEFWI